MEKEKWGVVSCIAFSDQAQLHVVTSSAVESEFI